MICPATLFFKQFQLHLIYSHRLHFFHYRKVFFLIIAENSLWSIIPSCTDLLTNISTQFSLFLAKCSNLLFFFLFCFCSKFLTTPELKQNNKKIEDINPSNCFPPLTWAKTFVPEKNS